MTAVVVTCWHCTKRKRSTRSIFAGTPSEHAERATCASSQPDAPSTAPTKDGCAVRPSARHASTWPRSRGTGRWRRAVLMASPSTRATGSGGIELHQPDPQKKTVNDEKPGEPVRRLREAARRKGHRGHPPHAAPARSISSRRTGSCEMVSARSWSMRQ